MEICQLHDGSLDDFPNFKALYVGRFRKFFREDVCYAANEIHVHFGMGVCLYVAGEEKAELLNQHLVYPVVMSVAVYEWHQRGKKPVGHWTSVDSGYYVLLCEMEVVEKLPEQ